MALDKESIEITLPLQETRQLHRYVNGVDIEEDVLRSRYIAAGLERIFACPSESESGIALLLLLEELWISTPKSSHKSPGTEARQSGPACTASDAQNTRRQEHMTPRRKEASDAPHALPETPN